MKKSILALPVLTAAFALTGCMKSTLDEGKQDQTDFSVTAYTPAGDTAWTAVADDMTFMCGTTGSYDVVNSVSTSGVYVKDKKTGQLFAAGPDNYIIKSIPAVK